MNSKTRFFLSFYKSKSDPKPPTSVPKRLYRSLSPTILRNTVDLKIIGGDQAGDRFSEGFSKREIGIWQLFCGFLAFIYRRGGGKGGEGGG